MATAIGRARPELDGNAHGPERNPHNLNYIERAGALS
jgi:hypothetical protein